ncbi:MAG TPA: glycoside hydrolase family 2 TIM barrel-domain containing protein [Acidobacteriota bacterium]|nr:glycoside hydrolase family 2 TIM barrel-domain containing protein [Acidobacteriota bacterium]
MTWKPCAAPTGNIVVAVVIVSVFLGVFLGTLLHAERHTLPFDEDWRFLKGEPGLGVHRLDFDDGAWQTVRLPHDWAVAGPFDPTQDGYAGKLPWQGVGCYRKLFEISQADQGKRFHLFFDGVMAFPTVYLNGHEVGRWDYGYTPFWLDLTPYLQPGGKNVLVVQVDTRKHGTRWYPGAGIYRKPTFVITDPVHIEPWGLWVRTEDVSASGAVVTVEISAANDGPRTELVEIDASLTDPGGKEVGRETQRLQLGAGENSRASLRFRMVQPHRWDVEDPALYRLRVQLRTEGGYNDAAETTFGVRSIRLSPNDGFFLNGKRLQLKGVNLHHDHGPLGAAFYVRAMERQLEIMREMGVNAIRTSHNPPAAELLDLCDRMGFVVWNELFDKWDATADRLPEVALEDFAQKHVRNFVLRDRNHPSVVVWSIGNEIPPGGEGVTTGRVRFLADLVRQYDPSRPVGMACHIPSMARQDYFAPLDFTGWNYARRYAEFREHYPERPIIYSESASALSTRDFFDFPLPRRKTDYATSERQVSSYDLNAAPWADIPDAEFALMERDRFVAGEFVWTGFDYLGEPTPFSADARSSYFGIVDLVGIPKDRYYLYRSYWRPEIPTVHIVPHWTWPQRIGEPVPVFVYTNGDSAELFLNGRSLGVRRKGEVPPRPTSFAHQHPAAVFSGGSLPDHSPEAAVDGDLSTFWASSGGIGSGWQVDLGETRPIRFVSLVFEREEKLYGVRIEVSSDGKSWRAAAVKPPSHEPRWGGAQEAFVELEATGRFVRLVFSELREDARPALREVGIFEAPVENPYYDVTYGYRLRWNDVVYQPGELRAVAYQGGVTIGEATVRTAGEAIRLRLTPDRKELWATGDDLAYIVVEALDAAGIVQPWEERKVTFSVEGPAEIAGVGNGNPLSLEPFQADYRRLFHGKAIVILRTRRNESGTIRVGASAEGLAAASVELVSRPPIEK